MTLEQLLDIVKQESPRGYAALRLCMEQRDRNIRNFSFNFPKTSREIATEDNAALLSAAEEAGR